MGRKLLKILKIILFSIVGVGVGIAFRILFPLLILNILLGIPSVQQKIVNYTADKVISSINKNINGTAKLEEIKFEFWNKIQIKEFSIVSDQYSPEIAEFKRANNHSDTLLRIKALRIDYSLKTLTQAGRKLFFDKLSIDGGVFNIQNESISLLNIDRIFPKKEEKDEEKSNLKIKFGIGKIDIKNFRFTLSNPYNINPELNSQMIDFSDLNLNNITTQATNIEYTLSDHDTLTLALNKLSAEDISGFKVEDLKGNVRVTGKEAKIESVFLTDGFTKLDADYFSLKYNSAQTLKKFVDSVEIGCKINSAILDFKTLGKIAPSLYNSTLKLHIEGEVIGPIANLKSDRITAKSESGQTVAILKEISLVGLPKPGQTYINGKVENATTNGKDLALLLSELTGDSKIEILNQMPQSAIYTYTGEIGGTLLDINTRGNLKAKNGEITLYTDINTADKVNGLKIDGRYQLTNFDVGNILGNESIGKVNAVGNVNVLGKGKNLAVKLDSIEIKSIELLDKKITDLTVNGQYTNGSFIGRLKSTDPNLALTFDGVIPISGDSKQYAGTINISDVNLSALGIDKSGRDTHIQAFIKADIEQNYYNELIGKVDINNSKIEIDSSLYNLGDIKITGTQDDERYVANLNSDFIKVKYSGISGIGDFIAKIKELVINENFSNLLEEPIEHITTIDGDYTLDIETFNTQGLCALLKDGLYIQSGTLLNMAINRNNHFSLNLNSGRIAIERNYLKNISLNANNNNDKLSVGLFSKDILVSGFKVDSTRINFEGKDNEFRTRVKFHNDTTGENLTNLFADISILQNGINVALNDSYIQLKGEEWKLKPANIKVADSVIKIDGINLVNKEQSISAQGTLSKTKKDSLGIRMENFNIALIDMYLDNELEIEGYLSGRSVISLNSANNRMYASIKGDSIVINNTPLGATNILGRWNPDSKNYDLLLRSRSPKDNEINCEVRGSYTPNSSYLDVNTKLNDFSLTFFEPFLSSVISNTSGSLNGNLRLFGPLDNLSLSGDNCSFDNFKFTLDYTKVPYTLNGPIEITENGINLKNSVITDEFNGKATIQGGITYDHFRDLKIDTRLRLNNIHALNTSSEDNGDFYGNAFASGQVGIKGDMNKLDLNISAQTQPKTFIHIPISKSSNASKSNLLTFIDNSNNVEIDPYDTLFVNRKEKSASPMQIGVNVQVTANENAEVWLEIDKINGDIIKAKGDGRINIGVQPNQDFTLNGNYKINQGSYHFVLMNITSRDFTIEEGSSVTLNGSPDNIDLNITGQYKRKAAINRLISDTSSISTPRMVEAKIYVKGKLSEPQISFGIDIPDLDPTTKAKVQNALNSDEKIQKQVASLLVSGSFIPDVDNGISQNSSNIIYSNVSSLISDQVEKIFNELGLPVDLGVNYTPGDNHSHDAFEVALSTQLFNNRVTINGNIGNDPYANYNGRDVIGNVDVDIKMDQQGKVRLNLFSHSTDSYSNDLEESQKSGIGVSYQREFNSFRDIFRRKSPRQKEYEKILKQRAKEERKRAKLEKKQERARKSEEKRAKKGKKEAK